MTIHRYIAIFDISIRLKCVSIQYHCLMYHDMAIYRYIVASLVHIIHEKPAWLLMSTNLEHGSNGDIGNTFCIDSCQCDSGLC